MPRVTWLGRHMFVIAACGAAAVIACAYANPYSLHEVLVASYDEFDTPPREDGTVAVGGRAIDFRLPRSTLAAPTIDELRQLVDSRDSPQARVAALSAFVRSHLNGVESDYPPAAGSDAAMLVAQGDRLYALCSDYALLLNEALQATGFQSRVVWLEGHVANEYYDETARQWVYVDAHQNVVCHDAAGRPLSIAGLIQRMERDEPVRFEPVTTARSGSKPNGTSLSFASDDPRQRLWYRNILLNGECSALSGSTLRSPSRWTHLLRHQSRPQMLVLRTAFDTSPARHIEPFRLQKAALVAGMLIVLVYLGGAIAFRRRRGDPSAASSTVQVHPRTDRAS
jgi:hypothetical protein